jgi:GNAT superfamily N-acetyltransferase
LSANLRIDPDLPSPLLTPSFRTNNADFLPPPSLLSYSTSTQYNNPYLSAETAIMSTEAPQTSQAATNELPQLSTYTAETEDDRVDGLRLVADSVAQQRQIASKVLIFHPINLAAFFLFVAVVAQYLYTDTDSLYLIATTVGGMTMSFLIAVRWATSRYLALAEDINWEWVGEDKLIVVKWGEEIIGALVLGWADSDAAKKPRGGRRRRGKAVVRAWTVRNKYRGKGIGEGLLEEAVKVAGERGADGILFESEHASKFSAFHVLLCGWNANLGQTPNVFCPLSTMAI